MGPTTATRTWAFPIEQGGLQHIRHDELGLKLRAAGKDIHCLEVDDDDDDDGAACGLFTYAPVQTLPGLSDMRACYIAKTDSPNGGLAGASEV